MLIDYQGEESLLLIFFFSYKHMFQMLLGNTIINNQIFSNGQTEFELIRSKRNESLRTDEL